MRGVSTSYRRAPSATAQTVAPSLRPLRRREHPARRRPRAPPKTRRTARRARPLPSHSVRRPPRSPVAAPRRRATARPTKPARASSLCVAPSDSEQNLSGPALAVRMRPLWRFEGPSVWGCAGKFSRKFRRRWRISAARRRFRSDRSVVPDLAPHLAGQRYRPPIWHSSTPPRRACSSTSRRARRTASSRAARRSASRTPRCSCIRRRCPSACA